MERDTFRAVHPEDRALLGSNPSAAVGSNTAGLGGFGRPGRPPAGSTAKRKIPGVGDRVPESFPEQTKQKTAGKSALAVSITRRFTLNQYTVARQCRTRRKNVRRWACSNPLSGRARKCSKSVLPSSSGASHSIAATSGQICSSGSDRVRQAWAFCSWAGGCAASIYFRAVCGWMSAFIALTTTFPVF